MSDFQDKNDNPLAAYLTRNRGVVTVPTLWKWTAQGKVFEAGLGMEDTAIATLAAINDQTASYSLQSPSSSALIVIPILLRISIGNDGSAKTEISLSFTQAAGLMATAFTLSGTALTSKHCLRRANPAYATQQATALSGVTVSALTASEYIEYSRDEADDAFLTNSTVGVGYNVAVYNFLKNGAPHMLSEGAAMLVTCKNSTTDGTTKAYMQWAEVTEDDLL